MMAEYKKKDILKIAKRINNSKRPYLLVNPLQAKHIPTTPSDALRMMNSLGELAAAKYGDARLVIGFAETATAIGAAVANSISEDCCYIHSTREIVRSAQSYVLFSEEHSHATEQKLVSNSLDDFFDNTKTVIFVDDEFSTGRTLINMINQLKKDYPVLGNKKLVAASIINRLSEEDLQQWKNQGIESVCLLKTEVADYTGYVDSITVHEAEKLTSSKHFLAKSLSFETGYLPDPRVGVKIGDYYNYCLSLSALLKDRYDFQDKDVLILGTEECMFPSLIVGEAILNTENVKSIKCHSTTRSPIGINSEKNYPIRCGSKIQSFYDINRDTYIYNLNHYDIAVIISDTPLLNIQALNELTMLLDGQGCKEIVYMAGISND